MEEHDLIETVPGDFDGFWEAGETGGTGDVFEIVLASYRKVRLAQFNEHVERKVWAIWQDAAGDLGMALVR